MEVPYTQADSFISITREGLETGEKVCQILTDLDAHKSVQKIRSRKAEDWNAKHRSNADQAMVAQAVASVNFAEDAVIELSEVTARRKMQATSEYLALALKAQQLGQRLYRNLWELSLSEEDKKRIKALIKKIAMIRVWEDLPATLAGLSYSRVKNDMDGVIAYEHAYGVTFIQYKQGAAETGWTVLRSTLEESMVLARSAVDQAIALLSPKQ